MEVDDVQTHPHFPVLGASLWHKANILLVFSNRDTCPCQGSMAGQHPSANPPWPDACCCGAAGALMSANSTGNKWHFDFSWQQRNKGRQQHIQKRKKMSAFCMALAGHNRLPQPSSDASSLHTGIQLSCGTASFGLCILARVTFPSKNVVRVTTDPV